MLYICQRDPKKIMRTIMRPSYFLLAIISILSLFLCPATAKLTASGSIFTAEADPGEHFSHNITMSLSSDETNPINLTASIQDWSQSSNGANLGMKDNPLIAPYSAKKILSISPETFTIKPGESQQVKIEGDMPQGDGGRYAIVTIKTVPNKGKQAISLSFAMNNLVLLTIRDSKFLRTGEIEDLSLAQPILSRQQNATMTFKNTGNYHYGIDINATIKDEKGNILATSSPDIKGSIIPTAKRTVKFSLRPESELKPGNYIVSAQVALMNGTVLATKEIKFAIK